MEKAWDEDVIWRRAAIRIGPPEAGRVALHDSPGDSPCFDTNLCAAGVGPSDDCVREVAKVVGPYEVAAMTLNPSAQAHRRRIEGVSKTATVERVRCAIVAAPA